MATLRSEYVVQRAETLWNTVPVEDAVNPQEDPRVEFHTVAPGVHFVYCFANVVVIDTPDGLVLIDCAHEFFAKALRRCVRGRAPGGTGGRVLTAPRMLPGQAAGGGGPACSKLRRHFPGKQVHTCIYTHGHVDHVLGILKLEECATARVVGHRNVRDRFDRYKLTPGYNAHINGKQFGLTAPWPTTYRYPDVYYEASRKARRPRPRGRRAGGPADARRQLPWREWCAQTELALTVGGVRLELYHDRGETDDATWVWLPAPRGTARRAPAPRTVAPAWPLMGRCSQRAGAPRQCCARATFSSGRRPTAATRKRRSATRSSGQRPCARWPSCARRRCSPATARPCTAQLGPLRGLALGMP